MLIYSHKCDHHLLIFSNCIVTFTIQGVVKKKMTEMSLKKVAKVYLKNAPGQVRNRAAKRKISV